MKIGTSFGVSRSATRGPRGAGATRTAVRQTARTSKTSASEAKNRLHVAMGLGVVENIAPQAATVQPAPAAEALSVTAFLKTPDISESKTTKSETQVKRNDFSTVMSSPEQLRQRCMDHAVLVFRLKRIGIGALSAMLGMPSENVKQALGGMHEALRAPEWDRLIEIMGVDPETSRLSRTMPHFLHVTKDNLLAFKALEEAFVNMRAARMDFNDRWIDRLRNKLPKIAVMQNDHLRVVVVEHDGVQAIDALSGVEWARGTEKASQLKSSFERDRFIAGDMTSIEFDMLFAGDRRINWDYVEIVARANRVSMEDIVGYIKSVGDKKAEENAAYLKVVNGN